MSNKYPFHTGTRRVASDQNKFLPSIHVSGNFYQVGYNVGRTFKAMIDEFVQESSYLNQELLPAYQTTRGLKIYSDTLDMLRTKFPFYIRELEGIADGSVVPFHKLMLLHLDSMVLEQTKESSCQSGCGCTTVLCNKDDWVIGHTEDALPAAFNHCYVVHAHIVDVDESQPGKVREEKFSSLCYAGHLPGFCMNVNWHGFVYTINIIEPVTVRPNKTPRHFLTRALLSSRNLPDTQMILRDSGSGSAHGFCVNMAFLKSDRNPILYSAEVGPAEDNESQLSILTIPPGETHAHCNKYLRLRITEDSQSLAVLSSDGRHVALNKAGSPNTVQDVVNLLSDESDDDYPLYRRGTPKDHVLTIATGIFDLKRKTWSIYADKAASSRPIAVFPIEI